MNQGTLSVIISNYNHAHYITEALEAILTQSCRPLEVIIIDDGSTDDSVEVIQGIALRDPIVHLYLNEQNQGIWYSANRGLSLAIGEYVYFAAADDRICPGFFEKSMGLLTQYPQAGLCSALLQLMGGHGEDKGWIKSPVISQTPCFLTPNEVLSTLNRDGFWVTGQTTILRRNAVLHDAEGFISELSFFADIFMDLNVALRYGACFIPEVLATWRVLDTGYAETIWNDVELSRAKFDATTQLMRSSKYAAIFPEAFTRVWERRGLYGLEMRYYRQLFKKQIDFFGRLRVLRPKPTPLDMIFLAILNLLVFFGGFIAKAYLWHRRINWDFPWLLVMLRSRFSKLSRQPANRK